VDRSPSLPFIDPERGDSTMPMKKAKKAAPKKSTKKK
jgi:hypothetical protein